MRNEILSLYKQLMRASSKFGAYNYRCYAIRKVQDTFKENRSISDQARIKELVKVGYENLDLIKRQVLIGQLYSTDKLIIE